MGYLNETVSSEFVFNWGLNLTLLLQCTIFYFRHAIVRTVYLNMMMLYVSICESGGKQWDYQCIGTWHCRPYRAWLDMVAYIPFNLSWWIVCSQRNMGHYVCIYFGYKFCLNCCPHVPVLLLKYSLHPLTVVIIKQVSISANFQSCGANHLRYTKHFL